MGAVLGLRGGDELNFNILTGAAIAIEPNGRRRCGGAATPFPAANNGSGGVPPNRDFLKWEPSLAPGTL